MALQTLNTITFPLPPGIVSVARKRAAIKALIKKSCLESAAIANYSPFSVDDVLVKYVIKLFAL